jgi:Zn-dependent protease
MQLILIPIVILSLVIHEFAHTFVAILLGDRSQSNMERLTLNPLKHIDPMGAAMIYIFGFGWAKPVRINPNQFKKPIRDEIIVALAGPASNFLIAFVTFGIIKILDMNGVAISNSVMDGFSLAVYLNIGLAVFNLLPIPPLDGSHFYTSYLYQHNFELYKKVLKYGMGILLIVILSRRFTSVDLLPLGKVIETIVSWMSKLFFPV